MTRRLYIVSYDICCPKRWRRVFKLMRRRGVRRQLSVFLMEADTVRLRKLVNELNTLIEPASDTILIAPIDRGSSENGVIELGIKGEMPGARLLII